MKKLLTFQATRMRNNKTLFLLPLLLIIIGISGLFLANLFYGEQASAKEKLLCLYNAYSQFTFLFLVYLFVSTFTSDYKNGVYSFMNQIGFSVGRCLVSKSVIVLAVSFIVTNVFIAIANFIFGNSDVEYLILLLVTINLTLIFTILFSMMLSLIFKKTMVATLIGYGSFVILNIINLVGFGLTNPADSNSISYITLSSLAGQQTTHYSISKLGMDFYQYRYALIIVPIIVWILILLAFVFVVLRTRSKKNEI